MQIGKYKIESDNLNIIVSVRGVTTEKSKNPGQETWSAEGYFANMKEVLKWLVDREVKETQLVDLKTVIKKQDEIYKLIEGLSLKAPELVNVGVDIDNSADMED